MKKPKPPFTNDLCDADGEPLDLDWVTDTLNKQTDLEASFEIAKKIKNQALARVDDVSAQLAATKAELEYATVRLDNTALRLQEAQTQLDLVAKDRTYWQAKYDEAAREIYVVHLILKELISVTTNMIR